MATTTKAPKSLYITLSDDEFLVTEEKFLSLHGYMCDGQVDNCIRCRDLCCPEGTCGLGGGWIETYRATYYQPGESEPGCTGCVDREEYGDDDYEDGDY